MRHISEYRDPKLAHGLARAIAAAVQPGRRYRLMEFCGGHTHAIARHGLVALLPEEIQLIHGPGCPVCVLPVGRLDQAIALAADERITLCTYADLLRVPASSGTTLLNARASGADVRVVYSTDDVLRIAQNEPRREVVFFAIGFETTTPPTAVLVRQAEVLGLDNLSVFCNHVLTPAAMRQLLAPPAGGTVAPLDGIIGPSHVSTVIGLEPYAFVADQFGTPLVVAGFEPLDVLQAVYMLVQQINAGEARVENQYQRVVKPGGNRKAQALMSSVFSVHETFAWRGLGEVPLSALALRAELAAFDAERRFAMPPGQGREHKSCECPAILRGEKSPSQCRLFGVACTPERPLGPCMVSPEGACAAHWSYGRAQNTRTSKINNASRRASLPVS